MGIESLKPDTCPFCGMHLTMVTLDMRYASDTAWQHPPTGCVLDGKNIFGKEVPAWNRRAPEPPQGEAWTGQCHYCPACFVTRAELEEHERECREYSKAIAQALQDFITLGKAAERERWKHGDGTPVLREPWLTLIDRAQLALWRAKAAGVATEEQGFCGHPQKECQSSSPSPALDTEQER